MGLGTSSASNERRERKGVESVSEEAEAEFSIGVGDLSIGKVNEKI